jgi:hypothetical protein
MLEPISIPAVEIYCGIPVHGATKYLAAICLAWIGAVRATVLPDHGSWIVCILGGPASQ